MKIWNVVSGKKQRLNGEGYLAQKTVVSLHSYNRRDGSYRLKIGEDVTPWLNMVDSIELTMKIDFKEMADAVY